MARPEDSDSTIFHAARALPPEERATYLDRACRGDAAQRGRVESLLRHDAETGLMATGEARTAAEGVSHATLPLPDLRPEERIGHFTIRQTLGEGGFGVVYQAEQTEPVRRMVALKVIKPGMDSRAVIARFEAERQALAVMDHPCVAKVFDGGLSEQGRPWFAMELVKGLPITEHCDRHRLSLPDRLELFIRVCEAVQHAHAKGVIHRDLKPSNTLVEYEGGVSTPKVIDFGVAKALHQRLTEATIFTEQGQLIGTPEYMSPEQAEMGAQDIDTRSDIYSLGVILYELLTGARPFEGASLRKAGLAEIQRVIREVEPSKPSTRLASMASHGDDPSTATRIAEARRTEVRSLTGTLRRDLDWVVMKCLEKERARRYDTANALAMELRRYLDDQPVLAGPPSVGYKVGKFVKRNRVGVLAASAGLVLLVGGLAGTSYGLIEARRQQAIAAHAAQAEAQQRALAVRRAEEAESALRRAEAAEAAADQRAEQLQHVSDFQAGMLSQIDTAQAGIDLMADIRERFKQSLARAGVPESERATRLEALRSQLTRVNATDTAAAMIDRTILQPAADAIARDFADQPLVDAQLRQALSDIYQRLGLFDAALPLQSSALATRRQVLGEDHPDTLQSMSRMSVLRRDQGHVDEADEYAVASLNKRRQVLGEDHPDTMQSLHDMGHLRWAQGRLAEAEKCYRESLRLRRQELGNEHPDTLLSMNNLAVTLADLDRLDESEPLHQDVLLTRSRTLGKEDPETLQSGSNLAYVYQERGRYTLAEPLMLEVLETRRRVLGRRHPDTLLSVSNIGYLYREMGDFGAAEPFWRETLDGFRQVFGDEHWDTLISVINLGLLLRDQGRFQETIELVAPIEPLARATFQGDNARRLASLLTALGRARVGLAHDEEQFIVAEANLLEAHGIFVLTRGETHKNTLESVQGLIDLYTAWAAAEPDAGHAAKATEWQAVLDAAQGATP